MIEARELRIGNLVTDEFYDSFKTIIEVDSISDRGINLFIEDDGNYPECAQTWIEPERRFDTIFGIPLTEEWFLKFGFKKLSSPEATFSNEYMIIYTHESTGFYYFEYGIGENKKAIRRSECRFIHQLQNLYFDFTNEELTLTK